MPKNNADKRRPPVNLAEFRKEQVDKAKESGEGFLSIELSDGTIVETKHFIELSEAESALLLSKEPDHRAIAQALLGDQYDAYIADGGTALLLVTMLSEILDAGEDDPGESEASSSS